MHYVRNKGYLMDSEDSVNLHIIKDNENEQDDHLLPMEETVINLGEHVKKLFYVNLAICFMVAMVFVLHLYRYCCKQKSKSENKILPSLNSTPTQTVYGYQTGGGDISAKKQIFCITAFDNECEKKRSDSEEVEGRRFVVRERERKQETTFHSQVVKGNSLSRNACTLEMCTCGLYGFAGSAHTLRDNHQVKMSSMLGESRKEMERHKLGEIRIGMREDVAYDLLETTV